MMKTTHNDNQSPTAVQTPSDSALKLTHNDCITSLEPGRIINLTRGHFTIVDPENYEGLSAFKWRAKYARDTSEIYVARWIKDERRYVWMHRFIVKAHSGEIVDHINRDTLDNRRANLRIVNHRQNALNTRLLRTTNKSGFRGVSWKSHEKKWQATPEVAAAAYDEAARKYHEGFAPLNCARGHVLSEEGGRTL